MIKQSEQRSQKVFLSMKYVLSSSQKEFFHKNGYLELEDVFPALDCHAALEELKALGSDGEKKHDTFRKTTQVAKWMRSRAHHYLAMQLFEQKSLRLAFDHFFNDKDLFYADDLLHMSSMQPLVGGFLLRLEGQALEPSSLPSVVGNIVFFSPTATLPLLQEKDSAFLLVAYTKEKARYTLNPSDPFTHNLKRLGYGFGDNLKTDTHPVIYQDM